MRIAVAGTHCSGKTTLVHAFLSAHRDYLHEPEPHEWLEEIYGEVFADEPAPEDFYRQLEVCVERLRGYERGARVVAERSPLDFVAYLLALSDLGRVGRDCALVASASELAAAGMASIDLLAVLPLNDKDGIVAPESEDLELREAMNDRLLDIIGNDEFSLFSSGRPHVVEVHGTLQQRVHLLEQAIGAAGSRP